MLEQLENEFMAQYLLFILCGLDKMLFGLHVSRQEIRLGLFKHQCSDLLNCIKVPFST